MSKRLSDNNKLNLKKLLLLIIMIIIVIQGNYRSLQLSQIIVSSISLINFTPLERLRSFGICQVVCLLKCRLSAVVCHQWNSIVYNIDFTSKQDAYENTTLFCEYEILISAF